MLSNVVAVVVARCRVASGETWFGRDLAGKSQLFWSIEAVRAVRGVSQIAVFTDEPALAEHARRACVSACWSDLASYPTSAQIARRVRTELADSSFDAVLVVDAAYPLLDESALERLFARLRADPNAHWVVGARRISGPIIPRAEAGIAIESLEVATSLLHACTAAQVFRLTEGVAPDTGRVLFEELDELCVLSVRTALELRLAEVVLRERLERAHTQSLPSDLQAVIFDFDGVMTDNAVWVDETGRESVRCDRGDGMGIGMLKAAGVKLLILSKERNPVVSARAKKLGLECLQGIDNKLDELKGWLVRNAVVPERALYIGNDVNDLACMRHVGTAVCPRDAHETARQAANLCLTRDGGHGAVRELCDRILERLAPARDFG